MPALLLKIITFIFLFLSSTHSAFATSPAVAPPQPAMVVKTALNKITAFGSTATSREPALLRAFISQEITPHFDFNNMAYWITGRYAKNMNAQDKINFKRSLREAFLSSLAKHLGSFDVSQTRFQISPAYYRGQDEAFVNARVYRPYMPTVKLYFRMRFDGSTWRIIDVKANGFSAVLYYRQHFINQLRQYKNRKASNQSALHTVN